MSSQVTHRRLKRQPGETVVLQELQKIMATKEARSSAPTSPFHVQTQRSDLLGRLVPHFGDQHVDEIRNTDVLNFRAGLTKAPGRRQGQSLSAKRVNQIVGMLCRILDAAADRYQFATATHGVQSLPLPDAAIDPFTLSEVQQIVTTVRADYQAYVTTRFFTGMTAGEIHGLFRRDVDFARRSIVVRDSVTAAPSREVRMSQPVYDALKRHLKTPEGLAGYVFCNLAGLPLDVKNFSSRIWYPLLKRLGYRARRPHQMRHTTARLWLTAGESPEWVARQLGLANTDNLLRAFGRFVSRDRHGAGIPAPDGSAMERMLMRLMATEGDRVSSPSIYLPRAPTAKQVDPQPIPKPRGIHGSRRNVSRARNA